ncbi:TetR/AcrR family transcriptional regulator [Streptomyces kanamyceticus]|uniref:TetR/AcrR family transcriptional regulator n=1 Tax=Streptomyces kanamyceticus TaxID=1967 RepID=A0A5J6GQR5_STRKN|nr:TetR/AcrR family transcriptional regulator [Streptomyces kanamyceticus]QEU96481.1 TetR/AcrR family transcriptional regulator [Streptomyces kanamyceticus]
MARVSQEHLDARRRQILDGAALCFARNGFHATSMQDVLKEVGLSAGAVYRYFRGKEELIEAIVAEVLDDIRGVFEAAAEQSPPPPPHELVGEVLGNVLDLKPGLADGAKSYYPRLMIQVWTETLRNDDLSGLIREGYIGVRAAWVRVVEGYQEAGMMSSDVPADHVARTMIAVAQGFAAQYALFDDVAVDMLQNGLRGLVSMDLPS